MCDPDHFVQFQVRVTPAAGSGPVEAELDSDGENNQVTYLAHKSTVKPLKVTEEVVAARSELYNWRRSKAEAEYGADLVDDYGPHLLMPDVMIDRIVACAQAGKLPDSKMLAIETGWRQDLIDQYGQSLLAVVHALYPDQGILMPRKQKVAKKNDENTAPGTSMMTRIQHCHDCGRAGHNREADLSLFHTNPKLTILQAEHVLNMSSLTNLLPARHTPQCRLPLFATV